MLYDNDPWLNPFRDAIDARKKRILDAKAQIASGGRIYNSVNNHLYYTLHKEDGCWVFREWAPTATRIYLIGEFNQWKKDARFALQPCGGGNWELRVPESEITHGNLYKVLLASCSF